VAARQITHRNHIGDTVKKLSPRAMALLTTIAGLLCTGFANKSAW